MRRFKIESHPSDAELPERPSLDGYLVVELPPDAAELFGPRALNDEPDMVGR